MAIVSACSVDGCRGPVVGRGYCNRHWKQWRKDADPLVIGKHVRVTRDPVARFWALVDKSAGPDGCWPFTGKAKSRGYGKFNAGPDNRNATAHIYAYELANGPVPDGLELDHLCHTLDPSCPGGENCPHRACVNPRHLEPVPHLENTRRGVRSRITHCPQGHPYDEANTYVTPSHERTCRICRNERSKLGHRRSRALGKAN